MRLLLAINKRSLSNSNSNNSKFNVFFRRSCFFVTTATVTTFVISSSSSSSSMSHAESHHPRPSSLTSTALEFGGTALSILGTSLNELGETAKLSATNSDDLERSTRTNVNTLDDLSTSLSSSSSSSSSPPPPPPSPLSPLPKDLGLQLSIGSVCGFCSGYALKKVGKTAAFIFGIGFISLQAVRIVQQSQHITHPPLISNFSSSASPLIDWVKAENEMIKIFDVDRDGKVSLNDIHTLTLKIVSSLSLGVPSSSAFAAAFILGIRWG
jgi:uncharacterized membrane protein (Fun14 family)